MIKQIYKRAGLIAVAVIVVAGMYSVAVASHSWNGYHWARTINPFTLKLGDNVSSQWDAHLAIAAADWSVPAVVDTTMVTGATKSRVCKSVSGNVQVCNNTYGSNGWLGIAQISISGSHILTGIVKLNDTYFNTTAYNTPAWRNLVMCQEIGHTLGLGHVDEDFGNTPLGTCMDYSSDPSLNQHPNQHDYDMLESIYAHTDTSTTVKSSVVGTGAEVGGENPSEWGRAVAHDASGRESLYEKELSGGKKLFTFVFWAK